MILVHANDFISWRDVARKLLQDNVPAIEVAWNRPHGQNSLFGTRETLNPVNTNFNIPASFIKLAERICYHRSEDRFNLLYQMLWRLVHENKNLIHILSDPLTNNLNLMIKSIRRDVHKTKAFVRFRKTYDTDHEEHYIAWHRPDHYSLKLSAPFFKERFAIMRWTILTPDESVHWDLKKLHFGPGATVNDAPSDDQMESLWKEFYRAIFNPARIKIKAMKKEMPVRHWATLPEAKIIKDILAEAPSRVDKMIKFSEGYAYSAQDFIPNTTNIQILADASKKCEGCPLYQNTTQTVFGTGPIDADMMLVGEQPGDEEDRKGEPFIGPAGQVLNRALIDAGIDRKTLYMTNAVKHFKFERRNGMRLHRAPSLQDIVNCKPWIEKELKLVQPKLVVCLGVTAAKSLIDPRYKHQNRGISILRDNITYIPTYHPSAILRNKESASEFYDMLVNDLIAAKQYVNDHM